jgi:hypothetical protein
MRVAQRRHAGHGLERGRGAEIKVFWFFSSEKNILAFCPVPESFTRPRG